MEMESIAPLLPEQAFQAHSFDRNRCPRPGEKMFALFRAAHHLVRHKSDAELMDAILNDLVAVLDARCGAIALADDQEFLHLRAQAGESNGRPRFSQKLAVRSYLTCKSMLCGSIDDGADAQTAQNSRGDAPASVICVLLRTAHGRIGVLQLGRDVGQLPFDRDDLHFVDAVAVYLSLGIAGAPVKQNFALELD
jgi:hypothetical protein